MANDWRQAVESVLELQTDEMSTAPGPALQWYPQQWLGDPAVQLMGMTARGCHHHLLMVAWKGFDLDEDPVPCSLPDDSDLLKALCQHPAEWESLYLEIRRGWKARAGRLWNLGLCRSYLQQMSKRRSAKESADARWKREQAKNDANAPPKDANAPGGDATAGDSQCSSVFSLQAPDSGLQAPPGEDPEERENARARVDRLLSDLEALGVEDARRLWSRRLDRTSEEKRPNALREGDQLETIAEGVRNGRSAGAAVELLQLAAKRSWSTIEWRYLDNLRAKAKQAPPRPRRDQRSMAQKLRQAGGRPKSDDPMDGVPREFLGHRS